MKTCEICGGTVLPETTTNICSFCNSNKEPALASKDSLSHHICGCD